MDKLSHQHLDHQYSSLEFDEETLRHQNMMLRANRIHRIKHTNVDPLLGAHTAI